MQWLAKLSSFGPRLGRCTRFMATESSQSYFGGQTGPKGNFRQARGRQAFRLSEETQYVVTYGVVGSMTLISLAYVIPDTFGVHFLPTFYENSLASKLVTLKQQTERGQGMMTEYRQDTDMWNKPMVFKHTYRFHSEYLSTLYWRVLRLEGLRHRVEHVAKRMIFTLFMADRLEVLSMGSTRSSQGVTLGLPVFFDFHNEDDIDIDMIVHKSNYVPKFLASFVTWSLKDLLEANDKELEELKKTLLLSEKAKMFAMAEALAKAESMELIVEAATLPVTVFVAYFVNLGLKDMFGLRNRWPPWARGVMYAILAAISAFFVITKSVKNESEGEKAKAELVLKLAESEPSLLEGGVEYYEKMERRNLLLRKLLKDGHKLFDEDGDFRRGILSVSKSCSLRDKLEFYKEAVRIREERRELAKQSNEPNEEKKQSENTHEEVKKVVNKE